MKYKIRKSTRENKAYMVTVKGKTIHFGDPDMKDYPSTKRGDAYCARSYGIKGRDDIMSPNYWSRKMWRCKGKKSMR